MSAKELLIELRLERWMADAKCAGVDPELFFPGRGESAEDAKAVCRACPVRVECLEYALVTNQTLGVWGGTSERQRRRLRRTWTGNQRRGTTVTGPRPDEDTQPLDERDDHLPSRGVAS
jgi:hypothetical protein